MFKEGKLFGKINIIDALVLVFICLALLGVFLVKSGKFKTSAEVNQGTAKLQFDVVMRGIKISKFSEVLKKGDKSFITIRNVPYTKLEIVDVVKTVWQTPLPNPKNPYIAISTADPTTPYTYNFLVTLTDIATITPEGAVIGGNKIKMGLPVELEGNNYRFNGIVSDVRIVEKY